MKRMILPAILALSVSATAGAETYKFDPGHTEIQFSYDHAGVSEQSGEWTISEGSVEFDPENIGATKVSVTIDAASVDTGVKALDDHLKNADFFEVDKYPKITFESTSVTQSGANSVTLVGDLTIKDTTAPVEMDFVLGHNGPHPLGAYIEYYQGEWIGVKGSGNLLRSEFGVGKFAPLTSDRVRLRIAAELRAGGW